LIILADWLIDGCGGRPQREVFLEVGNGLIRRIGSLTGGGPPPDSSLVDLSGHTLIPGLVDSHAHLCLSGDPDPVARAAQLSAGYAEARGAIAQHLSCHRRFGIVTVRDGGDHYGHTYRFKRSAGGGAQPVRLAAAGRAWHRQGRYGKLIGRCPEHGATLAKSISASPEVADHVKIVNSGLNSLKVYGRETAAQFSLAELRSAVDAAAARGLKTMVHANGPEPVSAALAAGCHSIEHGFFMGRDNLRRLTDRQAVWVPTAVTMQAYARLCPSEGVDVDVVRRTLESQLEQLRLAREYGVRVAVGTDAGSPGVDHGGAIVDEMALFLQAGYTIEETIACASVNGAALVGDTDVGPLAEGRPATFCAVPGGPGDLPGSLARLRLCYLRGAPVMFSRSDRCG